MQRLEKFRQVFQASDRGCVDHGDIAEIETGRKFDKVYEFSSSATTLPTAVYSHNDPEHIFTSITSSGAAIYIAGYSGIQSNIYKFTLSTAGAMPTLTSAITAAEMPVGEIVFKISYF